MKYEKKKEEIRTPFRAKIIVDSRRVERKNNWEAPINRSVILALEWRKREREAKEK